MMIKINLSDALKTELSNGNMKTVNAISHILSTNTDIKSDIQDINNTAIKNLYVVDNGKKYYCKLAVIDSVLNRFELSFGGVANA